LLWNQFRVKGGWGGGGAGRAVAGQLGERNLVWYGSAADHVAERNSQAGVRAASLHRFSRQDFNRKNHWTETNNLNQQSKTI
jgi:hypothetical protein